MPLTRSEARKRKKFTQNTAEDKITRAELSFRSNRTPQGLRSNSESESLEGFIMDENHEGAWSNPPITESQLRGMAQTPGSIYSFADLPAADIEEQEQQLRAQIGLPPRTTASSSSYIAPRSSTGLPNFMNSMPVVTTSNLTPNAPTYVPTARYSNAYSFPATSQRFSGLPPLNNPSDSNTDLLLKALLLKLDNGFSGLNACLRSQPPPQAPAQQPEMLYLTKALSTLNLQVQALSERLTGNQSSLPQNDQARSNPINSERIPNVNNHRPSPESNSHQTRPQNMFSHSRHHSGNLPRDWKLKYDGDNNRLAVEFFCDQIEILQEANGTDWRDVIAALPFFLEGEAAKWFYRFIKGNSITDWNVMKEAMIEYFRGSESTESLYCTLAKRKQHNEEKFDDFYHAVLNILDRIPGGIPETQLIGILRENVKLDIKKCLVTYCPTSLSDFVNKCRLTDKLSNEKNMIGSRKISEVQMEDKDENIRSMDLEAFASRRAQNSHSFANTKCWNCDVVGHSWQVCEEPLRIFCYWCGFKNVRCRTCPSCNSSNFRPGFPPKEPPPSGPPAIH